MKTKIIALAGMLALSLMTSVTFAQKPPAGEPAFKYEPSLEQDVQPVWGVIDTCDIGGVLAKNVNSGISNANSAGNNTLALNVDGTQLNLYIEWELDNSFLFYFVDDQGVRNDSGTVYEMGIKNNTDDIIYKYGVDGASSDTELNDINVAVAGNIDADRANNLDICLAPFDITPPTIEILSPADDSQESGIVEVVARVTDDGSGVDADTVTAVVYQGDVEIEVLQLDPAISPNPTDDGVYTWLWDTQTRLAGFYEIKVSATDNLGNPTDPPASVTVEVVKLFTQCFGTPGVEDFGDDVQEIDPDTGEVILPGGCNPTGGILIQTPPNGTFCNVEPGDPIPDICYITGTFLQPDSATVTTRFVEGTCPAATPGHCPDGMFPDCRMSPVDPTNLFGAWFPNEKVAVRVFDTLDPNGVGLDASLYDRVLAEVRAAYPDDIYGPDYPLNLDEALVWDEDTYCAKGCCLAAQHTKGALLGTPDPLDGLYQAWDTVNGTIFAKVHTSRKQVELRAPGRGEELVPLCYKDTGPFFLQDSFNVGYQPLFQTDDDTRVMTVLTENCNSPARTLTRGNGFDVGNAIVSPSGSEYTGPIDEQTPPAVALEAVEFRLQKIQEDFDRVFFLFSLIDRDGLLLTGNFNRDVQNPVKEAQRKFQSSNTNSKDQAIAALMDAVDGIKTKTTYRITESNPPGEALALMLHIIYELGVTRDEEIRIEQLPVTP